jgi:hypothetical protein
MHHPLGRRRVREVGGHRDGTLRIHFRRKLSYSFGIPAVNAYDGAFCEKSLSYGPADASG